MTNQTIIDLGRRAVACVPVERWPMGSTFIDAHGDPWIISHNDSTDGCWIVSSHGDEYEYLSDPTSPLMVDAAALLTEPATVGALISLVRAAWSDSGALIGTGEHWSFTVADLTAAPTYRRIFCGFSEAEALVAALEAAP